MPRLWKEQSRACRAYGRHRAVRCLQGRASTGCRTNRGRHREFRQHCARSSRPGSRRFLGSMVRALSNGCAGSQKVAAEMAGRAIVLKVDTERSPVLAQRYNVMSIPNFVVFKNGQVVLQQPGLVDHNQMAAWLKKAA